MIELIDLKKSNVENVSKLVYKSGDSPVMEVSIIRKGDGKDILCVPTQTNCKMGCKFCHLTGLDIPSTNLSADQIVELVVESFKISMPRNPTLLVSYMGVGEPLLNVNGVIESAKELRKLTNYKTIRFGVSTLIPGSKPFLQLIDGVVENDLKCKLHWSLHSAQSSIRKNLMPNALGIREGSALALQYMERTKQPVEVHYTLINGVNDSYRDIKSLSSVLDKRLVIKILRFAPHKLEPSLEESNVTALFKKSLESEGFTVEVYSPPGRDIGSSCGQFILDQYTK
jgi:adenine C2-methylase RlmN of 23S rRNA A2503 and tRNA A37